MLNSSEPQNSIRKGGQSFVMPELDGLYALEERLLRLRHVDFQQADGTPLSEETSIQLSRVESTSTVLQSQDRNLKAF